MDWYRNKVWNTDIEGQFEEKLSRSRGQRGEYLRIQALTLAETGIKENLGPAIALAKRHLEMSSDGISAAQMHAVIARSYQQLENIPQAIDSFRCAIEQERKRPNVRGGHYLEFGWLAVTHRLTQLYQEVLTVFDQVMEPQDLVLPSRAYRYFSVLAVIFEEHGEIEKAQNMAIKAMQAAETKQGPFWRLPKFGLVTSKNDALRKRVEKLSAHEPKTPLH